MHAKWRLYSCPLAQLMMHLWDPSGSRTKHKYVGISKEQLGHKATSNVSRVRKILLIPTDSRRSPIPKLVDEPSFNQPFAHPEPTLGQPHPQPLQGGKGARWGGATLTMDAGGDRTWNIYGHGSNARTPVNIQIPTKLGSKIGGEFTCQPKWDPKTVLTTAISPPRLQNAVLHGSRDLHRPSFALTAEDHRTCEPAGGEVEGAGTVGRDLC